MTESATQVASTQARAPPRKPPRHTQRRPSTRRVCSKRLPACAGKFCSSIPGRGSDNPTDPLDLTTSQKEKTVSFFYEGNSEFTVRVAPSLPAPPPTALAVRGSRCTPGAETH